MWRQLQVCNTPVFLGERLLPHGHVLLFIHQSEQRRT